MELLLGIGSGRDLTGLPMRWAVMPQVIAYKEPETNNGHIGSRWLKDFNKLLWMIHGPWRSLGLNMLLLLDVSAISFYWFPLCRKPSLLPNPFLTPLFPQISMAPKRPRTGSSCWQVNLLMWCGSWEAKWSPGNVHPNCCPLPSVQ